MDFTPYCESDELLALARFDIEKERLDQALVKLKQGLSQSPTSISTEFSAELGRVYARLGLRDRAKAMFGTYLQQVPDALNERFQLGMVHFESGDSQAALEAWLSVLAAQPLHPPALFYVGLATAQAGDPKHAWKYCQMIQDKVEPTNLYFGKARDLMHKIEADPAFKMQGGAVDDVRGLSRTEH